ncbi:NAD-dependent epimerase/dehydratase family protein [Agromyces bauzanensis]
MSTDDTAGETVVITGAAGRIGRSIAPLLRRSGRMLRLVDLEIPDVPPDDGVSWHRVSVEDADGLTAAMRGATAVVHLAGLASERPWPDILRVNVDGTQHVLEAARTNGVRRVFLASSAHAVGFTPVSEANSPNVLPPRPDTYYGMSKAALEALGGLYADRFGMSIVSARICTFDEEPGDGRSIALWLSPGDAARLVEAALALGDGRHHVVWGVSDNAPHWLPLEAGHDIGYHPVDDAVAFRTRRDGVAPPWPDPEVLLGGSFTDAAHPVGGTW